jgi:hypothetical protein
MLGDYLSGCLRRMSRRVLGSGCEVLTVGGEAELAPSCVVGGALFGRVGGGDRVGAA